MTTTPTLRASDVDRDRVVTQLQAHVGAGRLTLDEFSDRAEAAYRAQTLGELGELTRDLPNPTPAPTPSPASHGQPRTLLALGAVVVLALLLGSALLAPWLGSLAAACH